ncbi:MAG: glycosyltransferase family 39 protein, partial [Pseudomonadota bacterium]
MTAPSADPHVDSDAYGHMAAIAIAVIAGFRIAALALNQLNLGADEAQYWFWSLTPDFGYFSKPPMIAWLIGATTGLFGSEEWAIRLTSPLLHAGAAWALYVLGRELYGPRTGFWAALGYMTLPAVSFSSGLITTDAPLLFFWCLSLTVFHRLLNEPDGREGMLLGALIGMGLLSKYAMIYFVIGMVAATLFRADARRVLYGKTGLAIAATAVLIISPNLLWNVTHDFSTVSHTAANANWGASLFNADKLVKFLTDQFAVLGPLFFAAFLLMCAALLRPGRPP